jgi:hypothetical protein
MYTYVRTYIHNKNTCTPRKDGCAHRYMRPIVMMMLMSLRDLLCRIALQRVHSARHYSQPIRECRCQSPRATHEGDLQMMLVHPRASLASWPTVVALISMQVFIFDRGPLWAGRTVHLYGRMESNLLFLLVITYF